MEILCVPQSFQSNRSSWYSRYSFCLFKSFMIEPRIPIPILARDSAMVEALVCFTFEINIFNANRLMENALDIRTMEGKEKEIPFNSRFIFNNSYRTFICRDYSSLSYFFGRDPARRFPVDLACRYPIYAHCSLIGRFILILYKSHQYLVD
jgi:hypothetical protein